MKPVHSVSRAGKVRPPLQVCRRDTLFTSAYYVRTKSWFYVRNKSIKPVTCGCTMQDYGHLFPKQVSLARNIPISVVEERFSLPRIFQLSPFHGTRIHLAMQGITKRR